MFVGETVDDNANNNNNNGQYEDKCCHCVVNDNGDDDNASLMTMAMLIDVTMKCAAAAVLWTNMNTLNMILLYDSGDAYNVGM